MEWRFLRGGSVRSDGAACDEDRGGFLAEYKTKDDMRPARPVDDASPVSRGAARAAAEERMSDPAVPHGQHPASTDRESEKP